MQISNFSEDCERLIIYSNGILIFHNICPKIPKIRDKKLNIQKDLGLNFLMDIFPTQKTQSAFVNLMAYFLNFQISTAHRLPKCEY